MRGPQQRRESREKLAVDEGAGKTQRARSKGKI